MSHRSRRRWTAYVVAAVLLAVVSLTSCGGSAGTSDAGSTKHAASDGDLAKAGTDDVCDDLRMTVLVPVATTDEHTSSEAAVMRAFARLAADGPDDVSHAAKAIQPSLGKSESEVNDDDAAAGVAAMERLIAWAGDNCDLDEPVWACVAPSRFEPVGDTIDGPGDGTGGLPVQSTAERAAGHHDGTRVEAQRSDDEVIYAWLGGHDLATDSEHIVRSGDGWVMKAHSMCRPPSGG